MSFSSQGTGMHRDTWNNRQVWPWNKNEAGQRLTEFCQENTLVRANTFFWQQNIRLYKWTSPDGQHQNQIDYILCSQRWRSSIKSVKKSVGDDCGSEHELLIANSRLNLGMNLKNPLQLYSGSERKIQGIRSHRHSPWRTMDRSSWRCTGGSDQDHPQGKEMQKGKLAVWGGLTESWEKKRS